MVIEVDDANDVSSGGAEHELPVLHISEAMSSKSALSCVLHKHGYVLLRGASTSAIAVLRRCEQQTELFFASEMRAQASARRAAPCHAMSRRQTRVRTRLHTRLHTACARLPLAGLGLHSVVADGQLVRDQLHAVTDSRALSLLPWPTHRSLKYLRPAVEDAVETLHGLCARLLEALGRAEEFRQEGGGFRQRSGTFRPEGAESRPESRELRQQSQSDLPPLSDGAHSSEITECRQSFEGLRQSQSALFGDPSVLDCFRYPNASARVTNMRTHTDPGLLTITAASTTPGLQIFDLVSHAWVDVEARCEMDDLIVFCGEALEVCSRRRFRAAPHRVRHSQVGPRISVVFEMRMHSAVPLPRTQLRAQTAAICDDDFDPRHSLCGDAISRADAQSGEPVLCSDESGARVRLKRDVKIDGEASQTQRRPRGRRSQSSDEMPLSCGDETRARLADETLSRSGDETRACSTDETRPRSADETRARTSNTTGSSSAAEKHPCAVGQKRPLSSDDSASAVRVAPTFTRASSAKQKQAERAVARRRKVVQTAGFGEVAVQTASLRSGAHRMAGSTCVIPEVKKRSKVGELSSEAESSSMACVAADASSKAGSVDGFADPDPIARECGGTDDCAAPQHQRTRGTRTDMAACTLEEEEDCEMAAAHAYMTQFVRGRLSSGGSTASIFDEFGVPARFRPQSHPTLVEVCDLLLAWVTHCREQEDMSAALEGAEYVEFTPSFADCTGRFVDARVVSFSHA